MPRPDGQPKTRAAHKGQEDRGSARLNPTTPATPSRVDRARAQRARTTAASTVEAKPQPEPQVQPEQPKTTTRRQRVVDAAKAAMPQDAGDTAKRVAALTVRAHGALGNVITFAEQAMGVIEVAAPTMKAVLEHVDSADSDNPATAGSIIKKGATHAGHRVASTAIASAHDRYVAPVVEAFTPKKPAAIVETAIQHGPKVAAGEAARSFLLSRLEKQYGLTAAEAVVVAKTLALQTAGVGRDALNEHYISEGEREIVEGLRQKRAAATSRKKGIKEQKPKKTKKTEGKGQPAQEAARPVTDIFSTIVVDGLEVRRAA